MTIRRIYAHMGEKIVFDFKMDLDVSYGSDRALMTFLQDNSLPEPEVMYLMCRALKPGDWAIDGGANIGYFTLLMSCLVGPEGRVEAYEPAPDNFEKLLRNLRVNEVTNVLPYMAALWEKDGVELPLYISADPGQSSLGQTEGYTSQVVTTMTLGNRPRTPKLIKLDIEGAELNALRALDQAPPYIIVELNHEQMQQLGHTQQDLRDFMFEEYLYSTWLLHSNGGIPTLVPPKTKIMPTKTNLNIMFADGSAVSALYPEVQA